MSRGMVTGRRILILAEGKFGLLESKTANQAIRYLTDRIVGVIDSRKAGQTAQDVLGFGGSVPIFRDLHAALTTQPDTLLIGIAPTGGRLPDSWRSVVQEAIDARLNVISGLHTYLSEDDEFASHAAARGVELVDLRKVPTEYQVISKGYWRTRKGRTILTVGTDCNVGKMTASLELHREFLRRGLKSDFVATGQTGILLSGKGIAIDAVASDYVAGAIEVEVEKSIAAGAEFVHVEGQGSLTHQGYSGVTLGLMHGVMPDVMVMVHHPIRRSDDYGLSLEDVRRFIELHEAVLAPFKVSKVVCIAMNTVRMEQGEIEIARRQLASETGLPVGDALTPDIGLLANAVLEYVQL